MRVVQTSLCPTCRGNKPKVNFKWEHKGKHYCSERCYTRGVSNTPPIPLPRRAPE